jgi:hypothetical protein
MGLFEIAALAMVGGFSLVLIALLGYLLILLFRDSQ